MLLIKKKWAFLLIIGNFIIFSTITVAQNQDTFRYHYQAELDSLSNVWLFKVAKYLGYYQPFTNKKLNNEKEVFAHLSKILPIINKPKTDDMIQFKRFKLYENYNLRYPFIVYTHFWVNDWLVEAKIYYFFSSLCEDIKVKFPFLPIFNLKKIAPFLGVEILEICRYPPPKDCDVPITYSDIINVHSLYHFLVGYDIFIVCRDNNMMLYKIIHPRALLGEHLFLILNKHQFIW